MVRGFQAIEKHLNAYVLAMQVHRHKVAGPRVKHLNMGMWSSTYFAVQVLHNVSRWELCASSCGVKDQPTVGCKTCNSHTC